MTGSDACVVVPRCRRRARGRLAAVAGSGSGAHLEGDRALEGVAGGRSPRRLEGEQTRIRLRLDGDRRGSRLPPGRRRARQRRHRAQPGRRQGHLGEGGGTSPGERQRRWTARARPPSTAIACTCSPRTATWHASDGRRHPVAAKHPQGFPWPADPVADQRVPARRWTARRRDAGRVRCGHGEAGQDDGRDGVDIQGARAIQPGIPR